MREALTGCGLHPQTGVLIAAVPPVVSLARVVDGRLGLAEALPPPVGLEVEAALADGGALVPQSGRGIGRAERRPRPTPLRPPSLG